MVVVVVVVIGLSFHTTTLTEIAVYNLWIQRSTRRVNMLMPDLQPATLVPFPSPLSVSMVLALSTLPGLVRCLARPTRFARFVEREKITAHFH